MPDQVSDSDRSTAGALTPRSSTIILFGAIVVGTLDILFAILFWYPRGVAPARIFQSIAAGVYGRASFTGGTRTEVIGALLHYFIALCIVLVYCLASRRYEVLVRRPIIGGSIYGVLVYVVMNYVVIPLSATQRSGFLLWWVVSSVVVHAFLIGVPAALFARAALGKR
jgi:hypothetical protein